MFDKFSIIAYFGGIILYFISKLVFKINDFTESIIISVMLIYLGILFIHSKKKL